MYLGTCNEKEQLDLPYRPVHVVDHHRIAYNAYGTVRVRTCITCTFTCTGISVRGNVTTSMHRSTGNTINVFM